MKIAINRFMAAEAPSRRRPSTSVIRVHGNEGGGRLLRGKSFCDPEESIGFYSTTVGSRETGPVANMAATGILTSRDGIRAFGQEMSSRMNDAKVHATGVPSKGLLSDLLRCGIQKLSSTSDYIRDKAQHIQNVYDQTMKQYGQALLCLTEHSGGCLDGVQAYNLLSPEVRSNSIINTTGGAYMRSSDQGYRKVRDYINNADIVPMTNISPVLLNRGGNVIRTGYKSSGCLSPIRDHLISSPGYQEVLKRISEENLEMETKYR